MYGVSVCPNNRSNLRYVGTTEGLSGITVLCELAMDFNTALSPSGVAVSPINYSWHMHRIIQNIGEIFELVRYAYCQLSEGLPRYAKLCYYPVVIEKKADVITHP